MGLGMVEIIVIFLVVLLFFGAKRLPEVARSLGSAAQEFKKAKNGIINSVTADENSTNSPKAASNKTDLVESNDSAKNLKPDESEVEK